MKALGPTGCLACWTHFLINKTPPRSRSFGAATELLPLYNNNNGHFFLNNRSALSPPSISIDNPADVMADPLANIDFSDPATVKEGFATLLDRVSALESQLKSALDTISSLSTSSPSASTGSRPRAILPDPEKLSGASKWETWKLFIEAKLDLDSASLGNTPRAKFWYVYGNLEPKIQSLVLPLAVNPPPSGLKPSLIFDTLSRIYENPNKPQQAADRLGKLRQGTDTLAHFLTKFERTLYEANAKDWPDAVKISCLRAGLNDLLRKKLDYQRSVPSDYNDFVRTLHQLNSSSYGLLPGKSSGGKSNNNGGGGDPMDLSVIKGKYRTGKERMEAESDSDDDEHNYEGIHEVLAQVYA